MTTAIEKYATELIEDAKSVDTEDVISTIKEMSVEEIAESLSWVGMGPSIRQAGSEAAARLAIAKKVKEMVADDFEAPEKHTHQSLYQALQDGKTVLLGGVELSPTREDFGPFGIRVATRLRDGETVEIKEADSTSNGKSIMECEVKKEAQEAAQKAIAHTIHRAKTSPDFWYYMVDTQTLHLITTAHFEITGESLDKSDFPTPGKPRIVALQEKLDDIEGVLDGHLCEEEQLSAIHDIIYGN